MLGANETEYNGTYESPITGTNTFTYTMIDSPRTGRRVARPMLVATP